MSNISNIDTGYTEQGVSEVMTFLSRLMSEDRPEYSEVRFGPIVLQKLSHTLFRICDIDFEYIQSQNEEGKLNFLNDKLNKGV
ncbi:hypothetical protein C3I27_03920 [Campylobacter jejuni]|uniref:Uncharacterized protein n=1 Tax=Campylobacter jejuni TaxID=197 RepID=A0A430VBS3_CAMJU|nr:hypothetical protein C3I27_03920 [Campylobacter jejuni]RTJ77980.1 hypothetical protein C3H57_09760 [Campylobacter jejuni]